MSRTGLLAEFTAQGSFLNYLRQLKLDAESLIPPADEKKFLMHSKWGEAIDHVFDLFLPGPDANTYAHLTSAQLTDRYLKDNILAITNHGYVPAVGSAPAFAPPAPPAPPAASSPTTTPLPKGKGKGKGAKAGGSPAPMTPAPEATGIAAPAFTAAPVVVGAGPYTYSINLLSVRKLIYKAASYSCMKHHASIVDTAAVGDGLALLVILRDFANPMGSGSLEEARTKLRDHKLTAEGSKEDEYRLVVIAHIERLLVLMANVARHGIAMEDHVKMYHFLISLPDTTPWMPLLSRLETHSADKTSSWDVEKAHALQYIQSRTFKMSVKEYANVAVALSALETETAMYARRKQEWNAKSRLCVWCNKQHYDSECPEPKARAFYEEMKLKRGQGSKMEGTAWNAAKAMALNKAMAALHNEFDSNDWSASDDVGGPTALGLAAEDDTPEFAMSAVGLRDVEDFVDIVHMADNDTVAKGKNEPEMSYNIDRGDQASAQASYYAVVNGAQSGIFTSLEQARSAVPHDADFKTCSMFPDTKAAAQYLSDQGVCPKEERCHEIRTELIRRKLNPYGTYEQISRKLKADQGVESKSRRFMKSARADVNNREIDHDSQVEINEAIMHQDYQSEHPVDNTFTLSDVTPATAIVFVLIVIWLLTVIQFFAPDMKVIIMTVVTAFGVAHQLLQHGVYNWSSKLFKKGVTVASATSTGGLAVPSASVTGVVATVAALCILYLVVTCCLPIQGADALSEGLLVNNAAQLAPELALLSQLYKPIVYSLLCDSGASMSTCNIRELFTLLRESSIRMLTGDKVLTQASGEGTIHCQAVATSRKDKETAVKLNIHALYMPSFAFSLLSVTALNAQGYDVVFPGCNHSNSTAYIGLGNGSVIYLRRSGKSWFLDITVQGGQVTRVGADVAEMGLSATATSSESSSHAKSVGQVIHEKMNHLNFTDLQAMSRAGIFGKSVTPATFDKCFCDACGLGKLTVMSFPKQSLNKATRALGRVATDIAGIFPIRTVRGQRYYQVFVDEMSGTKWVYLMTDKSLKSVMTNLQQFRVDVGQHPQILRLDNDATFTSVEFREYCRKNEIKLEFCQPHRHQQNGLAERAIRSLNSTARVLLIAANISESYWGYAILHAAWGQNRMPREWCTPSDSTRSRVPVTPYELFTKRKPNFRLHRTFGEVTYALDGSQRPSKLGPQALRGQFLGYSQESGSPSALILTKSGRVIRSRDLASANQGVTTPVGASDFGLDPGHVVTEPDPSRDADVLPDVTTDEVVISEPRDAAKAVYADPTINHGRVQPAFTTNAAAIRNILQTRLTRANSVGGAAKAPVVGAAKTASVVGAAKTASVVGAKSVGKLVSVDIQPFKGFVGEPISVDIEPHMFRDLAVFGMLCSQFSGHRSQSEWEIETAYLAHEAGGEKKTPKHYREAVSGIDSEQWKTSMDKEYASLQKHKVFEVVNRKDLPAGTKVINSQWIFRVKDAINGGDAIHKSRTCAMGNQQVVSEAEKSGEWSNFAPVCRYEALRLFFLLCVTEDLEMDVCDIQVAFLNALIPEGHEDIYMRHPEGYGDENTVCKLLKCLYGLRDSPKLWNETIHGFMLKQGFVCSTIEPCLYTKVLSDGQIIRVLLYVDDLCIGGKRAAVDEFKAALKAEYDVTDHGPVTSYVGIEFTRNREARTGFISMKKYTQKVIANFGMANCNAVNTPYVLGNDSEWDTQPTESSEVTFMQTQPYRSMVACILWISHNCRSELTFTVKKLSRHYNNPSRKHLEFAKRVLAYLQGTLDTGIVVNRSGRADYLKLEMYSDSDWASDKETRKSTSGVMALVNDTLISWKTVGQKSVALSTMEAEYVALCANAKEAMYQRSLLSEFGYPQKESTVIYEDNDPARLLSKDPKFHSKAKHIDISMHFTRDMQEKGFITVVACYTGAMLSDYLTKFVEYAALTYLAAAASGYLPIPSPDRKDAVLVKSQKQSSKKRE